MQLQHVEAGALAALRRLHEVRDHSVHVGARHFARHLAVRIVRDRRCRDDRPTAFGKWLVHALPHQPGRALAARVPELQAELRRRVGVHEIGDALVRGFLRVVVEAGAAERDARIGRDTHHLGEDEPRATGRAAAEMHEMPVGRHAVDRRILIHRRDHDAVGQRHAAQPERLKHRHGRLDDINVEALPAHVVRDDLVDLGDEFRARAARDCRR